MSSNRDFLLFVASFSLLTICCPGLAPGQLPDDRWIALDYGHIDERILETSDSTRFEVGGDDPGMVLGGRWANGFGVEASWQRLAQIDSFYQIAGTPTEPIYLRQSRGSHSLAASGSFTRTLNSRLQLVALAGIHHWQFDGSTEGTDPTWGGRLEFKLKNEWTVGLGWRRFKTAREHFNRTSVQLNWHF